MKFWLLKTLLKSFCERDLDQWEMWKFNTKFGWVYISIARSTEYPVTSFQEIK